MIRFYFPLLIGQIEFLEGTADCLGTFAGSNLVTLGRFWACRPGLLISNATKPDTLPYAIRSQCAA